MPVQLAPESGFAFPSVAYRLKRSGAINTMAKKRLVGELDAHGVALARLHASQG